MQKEYQNIFDKSQFSFESISEKKKRHNLDSIVTEKDLLGSEIDIKPSIEQIRI